MMIFIAFDKHSSVSHFLLSLLSWKRVKCAKKQGCKRVGEDREPNLCLLSECQYTLTCWMMQREVVEEVYSSGLVVPFPFVQLATVLLRFRQKANLYYVLFIFFLFSLLTACAGPKILCSASPWSTSYSSVCVPSSKTCLHCCIYMALPTPCR